MPNFVDFAALKDQVSFAQAIELLDLRLKLAGNQFRGACPVCKNAGDRALVVTPDKGFFCFGLKKGGDQIALAAHVLDLPAKEAAIELAQRAGLNHERNSTSGTVPSRTVPKERDGEGTQKLQPLSYLEHDHEAVHAVGFDTEFCKEHGIGYAPRGMMRGTVAIPFRDEDGTLLGYIGLTEATLPADFRSKVVEFKKRA